MRRMPARLTTLALAASSLALAATVPALAAGAPSPDDPAYTVRDTQNIADAYGRITGPGGQLQNPAYVPALVRASNAKTANQLLAQAATPTRPALNAGNLFPGWNVGNPLRAGWNGTRGLMHKVAFTNRYGALLRGTVYRPLPGATDPYTGKRLRGPFPGVVVTEGSIQGSEGMYEWIGQDLAERGYIVLTYDVQGQGTSETFPHTAQQAFPTCDLTSQPAPGEESPCPGVPFQQLANFVVGTRDALSFFTSTPKHHYANPGSAGAKVATHNPYWKLFDHSPDRDTVTPGRTTRIAIIGHSLGAAAVSEVQATDKRVEAVVALDKLNGTDSRPVVPALAVQSEYGFSVSTWFLSGGSLTPTPSPSGPDPMRERRTGFDAWDKAGVDSMLIVPRASTHLEYTDIPLVLPASRYGQDLTSTYIQLWLDRYLKHEENTSSLLGTSFRYLEPVGNQTWKPVALDRHDQLSFYYCSAYALGAGRTERSDLDLNRVGC